MYYVDKENAEKIANWIETRNGAIYWKSINLSNPGASWWTPAEDENGNPAVKPSWQAGEPVVVKNMDEIFVPEDKEEKRIKIATRLSTNGFMLKLTDASSRKLTNWLNKLGEKYGAENIGYHFEDREAVITRKVSEKPLEEYMSTR